MLFAMHITPQPGHRDPSSEPYSRTRAPLKNETLMTASVWEIAWRVIKTIAAIYILLMLIAGGMLLVGLLVSVLFGSL